jgi:3-O-methylgallate 3,4-dioxygenase
MTDLVLGLGFSHSPMLSMGEKYWPVHAKLDSGLVPNFAELKYCPELEEHVNDHTFARKNESIQESIEVLQRRLDEAAPDTIIVIGDDQRELFLEDNTPTFAVYTGAELWDYPVDTGKWPPSLQKAAWAIHADQAEKYATNPDMAASLAESLAHSDFDVAVIREQTQKRPIGHAYTFVNRRLGAQAKKAAMLPILLNTYYPPNQPSASRCVQLGRAIGRFVKDYPGNSRVAVVASGGLSHFIVEEDLDARVLSAIRRNAIDELKSIPRESLQAGSSEILNWIVCAAACEEFGLAMDFESYLPVYRTTVGTGIGVAFCAWA